MFLYFQIYIYEKQKIVRYHDHERDEIENNAGIVGVVYTSNTEYFSVNSYCDPNFNPMVDINTKMPTLTMPLKSTDNSVVNFTND